VTDPVVEHHQRRPISLPHQIEGRSTRRLGSSTPRSSRSRTYAKTPATGQRRPPRNHSMAPSKSGVP